MSQLDEFKKLREANLNLNKTKEVEEPLKTETTASPEIVENVEKQDDELVSQIPVETDSAIQVETDSQTALGLEEPPALTAVAEPSNKWDDLPTETQLNQWWEEFVVSQPVRISSLLRTVKPRMENDEVVIVVSPSKIEPLDPIKFPFNRFIREISDGKLNKLRVDIGEVEQMERKPYTEREKLEYMEKKNPLLKTAIEKLDLKLP